MKLNQDARMGEGMAYLRSDHPEIGVKTLETLAADSEALSTLRAQAAYNLALYALQTGNLDDYKTYLQTLEKLPENVTFWIQKARSLGDTVPQSTNPTNTETLKENTELPKS